MFKSFTKKVVSNTKETVKEEIQKSVDSKLPMIIGVLTIGLTLLASIEPSKPKTQAPNLVIHNLTVVFGGSTR